MENQHVFARQSNMNAGINRPSATRSAGREGLEQPDRVLYVYDRVSTKNAMRHRMEHTPLADSRTELSGSQRRWAQICRRDTRRNLQQYYRYPKNGAAKTVHMGKIVDESVRKVRQTSAPGQAAQETPFTQTRTVSGMHTPPKQQYTAFERQSAASRGDMNDQTRIFTAVHGTPGTGGAAAKKRRFAMPEQVVSFFESIEERFLKDVDIAKKQAILHKKLQEHRRGIILALAILLMFSVCSTFVYKLLFVVHNVEVSGTSLYTSEEVTRAAGIEALNQYEFRSKEVTDRITFYCPMIKTADLDRKLPASVSLVLEDDSVMYCANIYGEIVALSPGLRVLGTLTQEEAAAYILLRLPAVSEAVAGRPVVFADSRHERYIRQVLEGVTASEMNGRISFMDLRDERDLILYCDGMYALHMGDSGDLKMKFRMADNTISNPTFPQNTKARLDLSKVGEASLMQDIRLDLTETP